MNDGIKHDFQTTVWDYYHNHGRHDLPWRLSEADGSFDPYKIMVSELMLQQTQVARVSSKYTEFLVHFPTASDLARAQLGDVLRVWSGLGYNRRAKFLHQAAQQIADNFPKSVAELVKLPGVGPDTAGAILAYAFNQPVVFIETNIRTVYIHHFFNDQTDISDKAIRTIVDETLDREHPREWYWALMDYGAHLKQTVGNLNKLSINYNKQSTFYGSRRQVRGAIIRILGTGPHTIAALREQIIDERLPSVLSELIAEGLIRQNTDEYFL